MQQIDFSFEKMTLTQKLLLMENLWTDLSRDEAAVPSPEWHADVLKQREEDLLSGIESVSSWADAKSRLSKKN